MVNKLKVNLQFFAGEFWAEEPAPSNSEPVMEEAPTNPLLSGGEEQGFEGEGQEDQSQEQQGEEAQFEELDFAGRRIKAVDPALKDLHRDFQEQNRYVSQTRQQMQQMEQQLQRYQQLLEQQQMQQQQQGPSQEDMEKFTEEIQELWYENPIEAMKKMLNSPYLEGEIEKRVESRIQPIVQERTFNDRVNQARQSFQDFDDHVPQMKEIIQQYPHLADDERGIEQAYYMARGISAERQPSIDQLLNNPDFISQLSQNEQVKNQILSGYMSQKQDQRKQTPTLMGNQAGGRAPQVPQSKPKSLNEASKAALEWLRGQ